MLFVTRVVFAKSACCLDLLLVVVLGVHGSLKPSFWVSITGCGDLFIRAVTIAQPVTRRPFAGFCQHQNVGYRVTCARNFWNFLVKLFGWNLRVERESTYRKTEVPVEVIKPLVACVALSWILLNCHERLFKRGRLHL